MTSLVLGAVLFFAGIPHVQAADAPPHLPPATRPADPTLAVAGTPTDDPLLKSAMPPSRHARKMLDMVLEAAKYEGPPIMFHASDKVGNACATARSGEPMQTPEGVKRAVIPMIFYNPAFMSKMSFTTGNEYVCLGILAHELGHLVHNHVTPGHPATAMHPWAAELQADEFAGMVMAKLGARPEELEICYRIFVTESWLKITPTKEGNVRVSFADKNMRVNELVSGSKTHPDVVKRIQSIAKGWKEGGGEGDVEEQLTGIFVKLVRQATRWEPGT